MDCSLDGESPRRTHEPRMAVVDGLTAWQRIARMEIKGHIQLFQLLPERQIPRIVQIHDGIQIANLRKSVDHCSFEAQFLDASRQLGDGGVRILHRQSRETCETIRPLCDELRQDIVGFAGHLSGTFRLRYALNRGLCSARITSSIPYLSISGRRSW